MSHREKCRTGRNVTGERCCIGRNVFREKCDKILCCKETISQKKDQDDPMLVILAIWQWYPFTQWRIWHVTYIDTYQWMNVFVYRDCVQQTRLLDTTRGHSKVFVTAHCIIVQGVQDQNFRIQIAITQKLCTWDPKLVKPKCVWEIYIFSQLIEPFVYIIYKNMKNGLKICAKRKLCKNIHQKQRHVACFQISAFFVSKMHFLVYPIFIVYRSENISHWRRINSQLSQ